jgi:hypothetical protein
MLRAPALLPLVFLDRSNPEQIIAYHPSPETSERAYALIAAECAGTIIEAERAELDLSM